MASEPAVCPTCRAAVGAEQRACPSCGASIEPGEDPTSTAPRPATPSRRGGSSTPGSGARSAASSDGAGSSRSGDRFALGALLAGRYRVLGLAGRGGMGEVYRAEDLKLDQQVALKFLPVGLESDHARLERLFSEVRVARQVSHPAVCRVWDVGEADGQHFLSMEYIDGENLSSLLRRIGRLPHDKAVDIARQICAGLAAAHEKGVVHRDLKPANIMLDGEGNVRITDFGLAGLSDSFRGDDVRSGTPAFMSPEQLQGREVTFRSDIYALGLVLYELFTGRRAFQGRTHAELAREQRDEVPIDPSAIVHDLPPTVERTILACLSKSPRRRPGSAVAVAAMLAGQSPLEAAIAAGDTPSPELVAAAGESEGLGQRAAWACMGLALVGTVLMTPLVAPIHVLNIVPADKAPLVLEDRAREILDRLGHTTEPADRAHGLSFDYEYFENVRRSGERPRDWSQLASGRPAVTQFWYRESPRPLVTLASSGHVWWDMPPIEISGMTGVALDLRGQLLGFYSVPPQVQERSEDAPPPDWTPLLAAAQLDEAQLHPATPEWLPPFHVETRAAWTGHWPDRPEIPIRVEAGAHDGRVVWLRIVEPWTRPERMQAFEPTLKQRLSGYLAVSLIVLLVAFAAVMARRNLTLGRGDRRGAARLATAMVLLGLLGVVLETHHVADVFDEILLLARGAGMAVLTAMLLWLFYLALEPYVRRQRPSVLVSWTRLLSGGLSDAVVGRDVLVGTAWGVAVALLYGLALRAPAWLGHPALTPMGSDPSIALGLRQQIASAGEVLQSDVFFGLGTLLLYLLLKLLLRREWIALATFVGILTLLGIQAGLSPLWLWVILRLTVIVSLTVLLLRFGLLAIIAAAFAADWLLRTPQTLAFGAWHGQATLVTLAGIAAIALLAFRATRTRPGARGRYAATDSTSTPS